MPLKYVAMNGPVQAVQLLIDKGAEVRNKDNDGNTPLFWAAACGHKEIVALLLGKGAEVDTRNIEKKCR